MKKIWETGILLFAMWGFWGMIYPDLCFTEDVCTVIIEGESVEESLNEEQPSGEPQVSSEQQPSGEPQVSGIYTAQPGQIKIKSRLLELLEEKVLKEESKGKSNVEYRENRSAEGSSGGSV